MIFAPAKSCMIIEPVTIGPIPRCMIEPDAPAMIALNEENISKVESERP